ncbi:MAG: leucine-rich repeat domain-containing protein [Halieaceae bacterium]|nr:leucine-rich repeat domain-containing protein [Halieaceae bacterium]
MAREAAPVSGHSRWLCTRWISRLGLVALVTLLGGCFVVELNGPVAGSIVELSELRNPDRVLRRERTSDDQQMSFTLGEATWISWPDALQIYSLGGFQLGVTDIDPNRLYLLTASGGSDVDHDLNKTRYTSILGLYGELYAIMSGQQLLEAQQGVGRINLLTTALYSLLLPMLDTLTDAQVLEMLDAYAAQMMSDLNSDGEVTYEDVLRWSRGLHQTRYRHAADGFEDLLEMVNQRFTVPSQAVAARVVTGVSIPDANLLSCILESDLLLDRQQDTLACPSRSIFNLEGLSHFTQIRHLDLSYNGINADSVRQLHTMEALESLNLRQNSLGAIEGLGAKPLLKSLNLANTGTEDLSWLVALPALEEVVLADIWLDNIDALAGAPNLQSLVIEGQTSITDWSVLSNFPRLKRLALWGPRVTDVSSLANLIELEELRLPGLNQDALATLPQLASLTRLEVLDVSGSYRLEDISFLAGMTGLRELYLNGTDATDWSVLADKRNLEVLDLEDILFYGEAHHLADLTELKYLDLGGTRCQGVETLGRLTRLEYLSVEGCYLKDISFMADMTAMRELNLSRQHQELADLDALAGMVNLQTLRMTSLSLDNMDGLANLESLTFLEASGTNAAQGYGPLAGLSRLRVLLLDGTNIEDLSPLSGLQNLRYLLLINSRRLWDATPLYSLTDLYALRIGPYISGAAYDELLQALPRTNINNGVWLNRG